MLGLRGEAGILDLALRIVEADFVHEDSMEADRIELGGLLHGAQILTVALTQGEDGAAGAERLFPEVRERRRRRVGIDDDMLRFRRGRRRGKTQGE